MSIIGAAIVTKTLTEPCNGQCAGTIEVTTDEVYAAYASTGENSERGYLAQDAVGAERLDDGTIVVPCNAVHPLSEDRCDGSATFTKAVLNDAAWESAGYVAGLMTPMDRP